ncbi:MAG: head-tail adaptor protein [Cypionkella sp.]|nr:head-tail adaptor protein [Cypionkella sp.]
MSAPHLSQLLALEEATLAPDGAGGFTPTWVEVCTHWAQITSGAGRQTAGEEVFLSQVPYRITLRAAPTGSAARPRPDQRLRLGPRIFTILAVAERDAAGKYLVCFCREEVPA